MEFPGTTFEGRLPNLLSLSLVGLHTDLRAFNFPSLTRFAFTTGTKTSVRDLTSFFERCPLLELIIIRLSYVSPSPIAPPRKRVRLAALKKLRLDETASISGLLDHLTLPKCAEMVLNGLFTGEKTDSYGSPAARIHPSSIDHLPVTRGITKAVAMPNSCVFSGPNGCLMFRCFHGTRDNFDGTFFASYSPISVSGIRELLVGASVEYHNRNPRRPWGQTVARVRSAFEVLTRVEYLTTASCESVPFFTALGATTDGAILLPGLRRLTIYAGCGDLDVSALVRCAEARLEHSRSLGEVAIVFESQAKADVIREVELLRGLVGLPCRSGPELKWENEGERYR